MKAYMYKLVLAAGVLLVGLSANCQISFEWMYTKGLYESADSLVKDTTGIVSFSRSSNVLYGRNEYGYKNGGFQFVLDHVSDASKFIGFDVLNGANQLLNELEYGFEISLDEITAFSGSDSHTEFFRPSDFIRMAREENRMVFYKNEKEIFSSFVDPYEVLTVEAQLISTGSYFTGLKTSIFSKRLTDYPLINHDLNEVDLNFTGNKRVVWEDGEKLPATSKYLEGEYRLTVYDEYGNSIHKALSVGKEIVWSGFDDSEVAGYDGFGQEILGYSSSGTADWGAAQLDGGAFGTNEHFWTEYMATGDETGVAFCFFNAASSFKTVSDMYVGLLLDDHAAHLVYGGYTFGKLFFEEGDFFLIRLDELHENFEILLNGTVVRSFAIINPGYYYNVGGLVRQGNTLEKLHYSDETYGNLLSSSWDSGTQTGEIDIDLTSIPGISGHFNYCVSGDEGSSPEEVYDVLDDHRVLGKGFSKASFLSGNHGTTWTEEVSEPGTYYVAAFDDLGKLVFRKKVNLWGEIGMDENQDMVQTGTTFSTTQDNAIAVFGRGEVGGNKMNVRIADLTNNNGLEIGLSRVESEFTGYAELREGVYISDGILQAVVDGQLQNDKFVVNSESVLHIVRSDSRIQVTLNDIELIDRVIEPLANRQLVARLLGANSLFSLEFQPVLQSLLSFYTIQKVPSNCFSGVGEVIIDATAYEPNFYLTHHINSVTLLNQGTPVTPSSVTVDDVYHYVDLLPGTYQAVIQHYYSVNASGLLYPIQTTTINVTVGARMMWSNFQDAEYQISDESIYGTQNMTSGAFGSAESRNSIETPGNYYVDFNVKSTTSFSPILTLGALSTLNWWSAASSENEDKGFTFIRSSTGVFVGDLTNAVFIGYYPINTRFRLSTDASGQASLRRFMASGGMQTIASGVDVGTPENIRPFFTGENCGFRDVQTNLPCPDRTIYAKPLRRLGGENYKVYQDKVLFYFDQEYESLNAYLSYKVFESLNPLEAVMMGTGMQPEESVIYGDNRYALDVSQLDAGHYILEIENNKAEKFYLRFHIAQ